jgi:hypothetical protein
LNGYATAQDFEPNGKIKVPVSEYQYYEFQALDRPLTPEQMTELRRYSSRAQITPTSFINVYNWGDFKGDPMQWVERYFDAFLYLANWGSRWFLLRVPIRLVQPETAAIYRAGDAMWHRTKGEYLFLSFRFEEEDSEYAEGAGWLGSLVPLRTALMRGDHRCLYLGWLLGAQQGELRDDTLEPPIPAGLGKLGAAPHSMVEFLRIDPDLVAAAAEHSAQGPVFGLSKTDISKWVRDLPEQDKDAVLRRMLEDDDPHIVTELRRRARREFQAANGPDERDHGGPRRNVGELLTRAQEIAKDRKKKEAKRRAREKAKREKEQAERRNRRLESLRGKEADLWGKVDQLIAMQRAGPYDEAVSLLEDLRDLARMQDQEPEFSHQMQGLHQRHTTKTALIRRFHKAKL